jgi:hypothetical protein
MNESIDLPRLIEEYGSESRCRAFLEALRWPNGIECPRCHRDKISRIESRKIHECLSCGHQFSATSGSVFHDTHLPLWKWFLAVYILCESKKGMSANQLRRMLGVSYKTAWYLCHRIRQAMASANNAASKLTGTVEIDDTWIGGKKGKWRPEPEKVNVVGMVERDGRLRFTVVSDLSVDSLQGAVRRHVSKNIDLIITDEWAAYVRAVGLTYKRKYKRIKHKTSYVNGDIHTNSIENAFSLLKRGIVGSWHHVSIKHLQRYLDEMSFRFSERENPRLFSDTLSELLNTDPITFKTLTAEKVA